MAKSSHPDKEVLIFQITPALADQINRAASNRARTPGAFLLELLGECVAEDLSDSSSRRSSQVNSLVRMQLSKESVAKIRGLAAAHQTVSAWAREALSKRLEYHTKKKPVRTEGRRKGPLFHPITGEPWVPVPFQGDSKWAIAYFRSSNP